ncbi:MAG: hypothetical protein WDN31_02360 [Hyphomicrobium sp.]
MIKPLPERERVGNGAKLVIVRDGMPFASQKRQICIGQRAAAEPFFKIPRPTKKRPLSLTQRTSEPRKARVRSARNVIAPSVHIAV